MRPIFIMSSERSGSNLVRKMLGAHSAVTAPVPLHLWTRLAPVAPYYGSLADDDNLRRFVSAATTTTHVTDSHLDWGYTPDVETILARIKVRNLSGVAGAIYEDRAARDNKPICVVKENFIFDYAFRIRSVYPTAKFIYLCRDGRDYACSIKNVPSHDQHVYFIAREWQDEQQRCIQVYLDMVPDSGTILLRYEDLIENPEAKLRELCAFLDIDFEPAMLSFHEDESAKQEAQKTAYWKNLSRPVMSDNKAKFFTELSPSEIRIFEGIAGDTLHLLGYPLTASDVRKPRRWQRWLYTLQNNYHTSRQKQEFLREPGRKADQEMRRKLSPEKITPFAPQLDYKTDTDS